MSAAHCRCQPMCSFETEAALCPRALKLKRTPRQLEAEAAHPAPARGRWKLKAPWLEVETLHPASARAGWKRKAAGAGSTMWKQDTASGQLRDGARHQKN